MRVEDAFMTLIIVEYEVEKC